MLTADSRRFFPEPMVSFGASRPPSCLAPLFGRTTNVLIAALVSRVSPLILRYAEVE